MAKKKSSKISVNNTEFIDNMLLNDLTYIDYLERFKKVALSVFEWVNLPESMNSMYLEKCLYYNGQATLLKDKKYGFINTRCSANGKLNIYGLPVSLHCYSYEYNTNRKLYTGLNEGLSELQQENMKNNECILVQNNWDRTPTAGSMELFAYRLYEAQRTIDVNLNAQKTPILILINESQRLTMQNLYSKYEGNIPIIFGDKDNLNPDSIKAIKTDAPFIADKVREEKKEIWNEALTYLRN